MVSGLTATTRTLREVLERAVKPPDRLHVCLVRERVLDRRGRQEMTMKRSSTLSRSRLLREHHPAWRMLTGPPEVEVRRYAGLGVGTAAVRAIRRKPRQHEAIALVGAVRDVTNCRVAGVPDGVAREEAADAALCSRQTWLVAPG
jgi:hypothetical protein